MTCSNTCMWKSMKERSDRLSEKSECVVITKLDVTPSLSYLTGFCTGDCASQIRSGYIQLISSSTHPGFLFAFSKAAERCNASSLGIYPSERTRIDGSLSYRWFCWATFPRVYAKYFRFDPSSMISGIGDDDRSFYSYLAGFADAEGNWQASRNNVNNVQFVFRLFSTNTELLLSIAVQLANRGFSCSVRLKESAGSRVQAVALKRDYWLLKISKRSDVIKLAETLHRLSLHFEKVERMKFILQHKAVRNWSALENSWQNLRRKTVRSTEECVELARLKYKSSQQLKAS